MSYINKLTIKLFTEYVGEDLIGNKYYQSNKADYLGQKKRYVIYKGIAEPSKVVPEWHSWLHHLNDNIPLENTNYSWQKSYVPNLSGTKYRYRPEISSGIKKLTYNRWEPK